MLMNVIRRCRQWLFQNVLNEIAITRATTLALQLPDSTLTIYYDGRDVLFYLPQAAIDSFQRAYLVDLTFFEERNLHWTKKRFGLRDAVVLDIGANIGNHSLYYSLICGARTVHAFEPNPRAAEILKRNLQLNAIENVALHPFGLSDADGTMAMTGHTANQIGTVAFANDPNGTFSAKRLDSLGLNEVDFVKIDVEGMTRFVLAGATETLAAFKPPIAAEIFGFEKRECLAILSRLGYRQTHRFATNDYLFEAS